MTFMGELFLLLNEMTMPMFVSLPTHLNLDQLMNYRNWFCDRMFDSVPVNHYLYSILEVFTNQRGPTLLRTLPLVYWITCKIVKEHSKTENALERFAVGQPLPLQKNVDIQLRQRLESGFGNTTTICSMDI